MLLSVFVSPISIHAPREGGDYKRGDHPEVVDTIFQSTPPARGATVSMVPPSRLIRFQSTPPARGATLHCMA